MGNYFRTLSKSFGSGWTNFWFTPSDPIVLSLVRVLTGLVGIWWYLGYWAQLQNWFGPNGIFPLEFIQQMRGDAGEQFAISILEYVHSSSELWFVFAVGLAALVLMTVGFFTRITTIASLLFALSFVHRGWISSRPVDDMLVILLFYLCIGPAGANFSIDAWWRNRKTPAGGLAMNAAAAIPYSSAATVAIRLIQVHLALVYAAMALSQLMWPTWWQGTAVWWMMARPESRLVDLTGLSGMGLAFEYFDNFCTHAIVLYELCFALLAWNKLARPILLVLGLFVWGGFALVAGARSFAVLMLVANLAFLSPEILRGWSSGRQERSAGEREDGHGG